MNQKTTGLSPCCVARIRQRLIRQLIPSLAGASVLFGSSGCTDRLRTTELQVVAVLDQQVQAWNAGDIDAFMRHYWRSPKLSFSSGGNTERGWESTMNRYNRRYPDKEAMGQLEFAELEVRPLGANRALVLGQWHLDREAGPLGGRFTLLFEEKKNDWLITHDHTSTAAAEDE